VSTRQCPCCLLPFRGAATRAYVVRKGALVSHLVCPTCRDRGVLIVSPPERPGELRGVHDLDAPRAPRGPWRDPLSLGALARSPRPESPEQLAAPAAAPWCRVCCDRLIGPWQLEELASPLQVFVKHDDPAVSTLSPGCTVMVCETCAGGLRRQGCLVETRRVPSTPT
jgi:hypothetical protein